MNQAREIVNAVAREIKKGVPATCNWITEEKALQELPFTKNQLTTYRATGVLSLGHHYKVLGKQVSKDGSSRGRKTILYHLPNMIDFVNRV